MLKRGRLKVIYDIKKLIFEKLVKLHIHITVHMYVQRIFFCFTCPQYCSSLEMTTTKYWPAMFPIETTFRKYVF